MTKTFWHNWTRLRDNIEDNMKVIRIKKTAEATESFLELYMLYEEWYR